MNAVNLFPEGNVWIDRQRPTVSRQAWKGGRVKFLLAITLIGVVYAIADYVDRTDPSVAQSMGRRP